MRLSTLSAFVLLLHTTASIAGSSDLPEPGGSATFYTYRGSGLPDESLSVSSTRFLGNQYINSRNEPPFSGVYFSAEAPGRLFDGVSFSLDKAASSASDFRMHAEINNTRTYGVFGKDYITAANNGAFPDVRYFISASFSLPEVSERDIISITHTSYYRLGATSLDDYWSNQFSRETSMGAYISNGDQFIEAYAHQGRSAAEQDTSELIAGLQSKSTGSDSAGSNLCAQSSIALGCLISFTQGMNPSSSYFRTVDAWYDFRMAQITDNSCPNCTYTSGDLREFINLDNYRESFRVVYRDASKASGIHEFTLDVAAESATDLSCSSSTGSSVLMRYINGALARSCSQGLVPAFEYTVNASVPEPTSSAMTLTGIFGLMCANRWRRHKRKGTRLF